LLMLGAFGAGASALERRRSMLATLEARILASRDRGPTHGEADLTVKAVLGGIREVTAERLRSDRVHELPELVAELAAWAGSYPRRIPEGLAAPAITRREPTGGQASVRARAAEGRLPSGRSDMPRQFIVKSQRERIVDATAAIVAEKGLAGLTIPEIARRANVSNQTFYSIYGSKHEAFLGAQKVGMHQALGVAVAAYESCGSDWPRAIAAGISALVDFLASEPAHAHLVLVDTFAANPEAIEVRNASMHAFASYLQPGHDLAGPTGAVPAIAGEAVVGGIWQVLHHYIENECIDQLPEATPQLIYMALTPFIGPQASADVARTTTAEASQATSRAASA
jgi:AcrR family transcriptional regulator